MRSGIWALAGVAIARFAVSTDNAKPNHFNIMLPPPCEHLSNGKHLLHNFRRMSMAPDFHSRTPQAPAVSTVNCHATRPDRAPRPAAQVSAAAASKGSP